MHKSVPEREKVGVKTISKVNHSDKARIEVQSMVETREC